MPSVASPALAARLGPAHAVLDAHAGREHRCSMPGHAAPSSFRRPLSAWGGAVDRVALEAAEKLFVSGDAPPLDAGARHRIDELVDRYASPDLLDEPSRFFRPTALPAGVRTRPLGALPGGDRRAITWRSTYRTFDPAFQDEYDRFDRNPIARVHHLRHDTRGGPVLVCLHAWCGGQLTLEERIFGARRFYALGYDVVLFTLPFHGSRTPRVARFGGQLFPSREVRRSTEAFGQTIADLRTLLALLRDDGAGPIGVAGISLGGYATALAASVEPSLAFAIPIAAPCSFADILWHHGAGRAGRADAERAGVGLWDLRSLWAVHSPLGHRLALPTERALLIWGDGDVIVPRVQSLALWEHWGRPEIYGFVGGHILQLGWAGWQNAMAGWLGRAEWLGRTP